MKVITAIIKPFELDEVKTALQGVGDVDRPVRIRTGEEGADAL